MYRMKNIIAEDKCYIKIFVQDKNERNKLINMGSSPYHFALLKLKAATSYMGLHSTIQQRV